MYQRQLEIVFTEGKKSRLTVTPHRVTVKVSKTDRDFVVLLVLAGQKIARQINSDKTQRGEFDLLSGTVKMQTDRRRPATHVAKTYDFDGVET